MECTQTLNPTYTSKSVVLHSATLITGKADRKQDRHDTRRIHRLKRKRFFRTELSRTPCMSETSHPIVTDVHSRLQKSNGHQVSYFSEWATALCQSSGIFHQISISPSDWWIPRQVQTPIKLSGDTESMQCGTATPPVGDAAKLM